ncbi:hypothetical protein [Methylobacterium sp. sgz302541]|uniref:hypothetical protein n=1 Tax=unclassified Methylobacterium TaxID=2615210 RepID=UPI003D3455F8
MIVALFALAAAMMIGGIASVIQGFPFVRLESGLAMTIAGAGVASAGAVLFGLGAVVSALRRVEGALEFRRLAEEVRPPALAAASTEAAIEPPPAPAPPAAAALPGSALPAAALAGLAVGGLAGSRSGREPVFDGSTFGTPAPGDPPLPDFGHPQPAPEDELHDGGEMQDGDIRRQAASEAEPELPLPVPPETLASLDIPEATATEPAEREEPASEREIAAEEDLFAGPEPLPPPPGLPVRQEPEQEPEPAEDEAPALRPSLIAEEPRPEPAPEPDRKPEPAPAREVVGTYASGGNTYVMYSDGAIEAETPRGRFSFGSLDELKAFVEAGGEADRGAA